ncbi:hypothetical protein [Noviherbaspirillum malthae]|uniref:hypothetical protein n=1 Tax=Noviherbaspirillum malthae TaxID=1260987 RepID=UPI0018901607|nr:hypothetical protein [Noviherbaspirillum malthae]
MSVHLEKCRNPLCRRLYELEHFSQCFAPQTMAAGVIICPHCKVLVAANPTLVYSARPIPKAFEHWPEVDFTITSGRKNKTAVLQRSYSYS